MKINVLTTENENQRIYLPAPVTNGYPAQVVQSSYGASPQADMRLTPTRNHFRIRITRFKAHGRACRTTPGTLSSRKFRETQKKRLILRRRTAFHRPQLLEKSSSSYCVFIIASRKWEGTFCSLRLQICGTNLQPKAAQCPFPSDWSTFVDTILIFEPRIH